MNEYLKELLQKFNTNPEDESLLPIEKILLGKIVEVEKGISDVLEQVKKAEENLGLLNSNLIQARGQSQGFVSALLTLKEEGIIKE